jgi:hypothetical protein
VKGVGALAPPIDPPRLPFDRKAYQRAYMVEWRKRQKSKKGKTK